MPEAEKIGFHRGNCFFESFKGAKNILK